MIQIEGIAIRRERGGKMVELSTSDVSDQVGLEHDAGRKPGKFMVTVLSKESWQSACDAVDEALHWTERRANILISGYQFSEQDVGKTLVIGDCKLSITRETDPCHLMDAVKPGLKQALQPEWRGGVRAQVEQGGTISIGDQVHIREND